MRRLFTRIVLKYDKYLTKSNLLRSNNFVRFFGNEHHPALIWNEHSLTGRILHYLNGHHSKLLDSNHKASGIIQSLLQGQATNLHTCNNEDLLNACSMLLNIQNEHAPNLLNELALECCIRLTELEPKDIYKILNVYMTLAPEKICRSKFYQLAIEDLCEKVDELSKEDLVQLLFYIGLKKKSSDSQSKIKLCMNLLNRQYINELTTEDLCIVCNATFKTSTKISNKNFLEKVCNYLNDNLCILKDPALFITFIKTIRHNRCQDDDLLSTISCAVFFNKTLECYSFTAICHLLALYSDHLYYDEALLNVLATRCIDELKKLNFENTGNFLEYPRFKDIKRLLWALSNINYPLSKTDIKNVIVPQIMNRFYLGEIRNDHESLIEIILYLWMMNYHAYELAPHALTPEYVKEVASKKSLGVKRLNLLLSCIYFEDRDFFKSLGLRAARIPYNNPNDQLQKRPALNRVLNHLKYLTTKIDLNKFEISYQIPYLNILGITGYRNNIYKAVNIEILDNFTCVKNRECYPSGPMQLKLRILEKMEDALIVIPIEDIDDLTEAELTEYLLDEINLVC